MEKPVRVQNATGSPSKPSHLLTFLRDVMFPCHVEGFLANLPIFWVLCEILCFSAMWKKGQEETFENATCRSSLLPLSFVSLPSSLHTLGGRRPQNESNRIFQFKIWLSWECLHIMSDYIKKKQDGLLSTTFQAGLVLHNYASWLSVDSWWDPFTKTSNKWSQTNLF